jgi:hypothetical protein
LYLPFFSFSIKESKQAFQIIILGGKKQKGGELIMSQFDDADVISTYALDQAIADGVLVEIFKDRWQELSGGKPIVTTEHLFNDVSLAGLMEIWNEFVSWQKDVMPTLPKVDRFFHTTMNGKKVWVIEDPTAYTLLYPEDY